jgi:salicylate hydroxylase
MAEHRDDLFRGLLRYQSLRLDRISKIVPGCAANSARFHNPVLADTAEARRYVEREWSEERI